jgi:glycosyltransferase involved in cell wall biosynthesis
MSEDNILALIPAWNEEAFIGPVIEATRTQLPVLVVDDGSKDRTPDLAISAGAMLVQHSENKGKGQALITGFNWALAQGFEAVVTLDADGQHDPEEIPKFLSAYRENAGELIIGRRDFRQMPFPNRFANPIGSWLLSLALRQRIYDNQSGYRLYTRRLLESLHLQMTGFELEVEVVMQTVCLGMTIGWVPIRTIYGTGKVSYFHPLHDTIKFLRMVWYAYQYRRKYHSQSQRSS